MKTVWHWKNIFFTCITVLTITTIVVIIGIVFPLWDKYLTTVSPLIGVITGLGCLAKWDLWHFE